MRAADARWIFPASCAGIFTSKGREIASFFPGDPAGYRANLPFTWGAQPANGLIFFNDINSGIWIVKLGKPKFQGSTTAPPMRDEGATAASPF